MTKIFSAEMEVFEHHEDVHCELVQKSGGKECAWRFNMHEEFDAIALDGRMHVVRSCFMPFQKEHFFCS